MIKHILTVLMPFTVTPFFPQVEIASSRTVSQKPSMYFPSTSSEEWQQISPAELKWNEKELENLYEYLQQKNTKAFIILKDGKIVTEKYFGNFTKSSKWYWASAGKTVTAFLVGIAQSEGLLDINNKTSDYLGKGWTSAPYEKEKLIHQKPADDDHRLGRKS